MDKTNALAAAAGVPCELVRSRRRTLSIHVLQDGAVQVRAPLRLPFFEIEAFVRSKARWIADKRAQALERARATESFAVVDGGEALFLGQRLTLAVVEGAAAPAQERGTLSLPAGPDAARSLERWYRAQARRVLEERVRLLSAATGIPCASVGITGARHRWGSCSASGRLNFNWRLVMAPVETIDAVVAHELAHVLHHDHSQRFWQCVYRILPDYRRRERWLRDNRGILGFLP